MVCELLAGAPDHAIDALFGVAAGLGAAMTKLIFIAGCLAATASAQHRIDNELVVTLRGMGALRIHTESTAPHSRLAGHGVMAIDDEDVSHRIVMSPEGKLAFAYDLSMLGGIVIVRPADPGHLDSRHRTLVPGTWREYPTIASAREFKAGEAIRLELLSDPSSGERLFDVIEPVATAEHATREVRPENEISLRNMQIRVNGVLAHESRNSWIINEEVRIDVPGRGSLLLVAAPRGAEPIEALGHVEGGKISFALGADQVEIVSRSNVLKTREFGTVWVYRAPINADQRR
jgi:hypothetical protein